MLRFTGSFVVCAAALLACCSSSSAALVLTINNYTTDELSFSISGFFDANTIGESEGYLALKNDWTNNVGVHTELFSALPIVTLNTIQIGGVAIGPLNTFVQDFFETWTDNVFFRNPLGTETPILAGTTVSGTLTLSGVGLFNPGNINTLELVSGFNRPLNLDDWARFEARANGANPPAVPEPATFALFGLGSLGAMGFVRRRKS